MHRTWWRVHPLAQDAILAASLFVAVSAIAIAAAPRAPFSSTEDFAQVVGPLAAACAAVVIRRQFTLVSWALTIVIAGTALAVAGQVAPIAAVLVATYTVATRCLPSRSILCAAVSIVVLAPLALLSTTPFDTWIAFSLAAWIGMATAIGVTMRSQRALVTAAEERAEAAEASRRQGELRAVAEERLRIARDLHDLVAHHIAVINVHAGVARHVLTSNPPEAEVALAEVRNAAQGALTEASVILGLLRNPEDEQERSPLGSVADVTALVATLRKAGHEIQWRIEGPVRPLNEAVELACFRIIQEGLTNAVKHGVGDIRACLRYLPRSIVIELTNAIDRLPSPGSAGHGLIGMQERVASHGGAMTANTQGHRFVVCAEIPTGPMRQES